MVAKTLFAAVAPLLLIQSIAAQCLGAYNGIGPYGAGCASPCRYGGPASALSASNGPGLAITSASPISPIGVSVASENVIEGALAVAGALPFLGTVGLEGLLPTAGAGNVAYNCGNGAVAITAEDVAAAPLGYAAGPLGYAGAPLGYAGSIGYGTGLAPSRCPYGFRDGALGYDYCPYGYGDGPYDGPYGAGYYGYGGYPYGYGSYGGCGNGCGGYGNCGGYGSCGCSGYNYGIL